MESTLATLIKIAQISQELSVALTDASARGVTGLENARAQFWLDKIMVSSREILELLHQCTTDSTSPDPQLDAWISTNGPVICLLALNEMKRMIRPVEPAGKTRFGYILPGIFNSTPSHENIHGAIKIFDNHRTHFDVLLMSGVWWVSWERDLFMSDHTAVNQEPQGGCGTPR